MRSIEIIVSRDGKVQFKYQGFKGRLCLDEASKLQQLLKQMGLDINVESITPTEEANVVEREKTKAINSSG